MPRRMLAPLVCVLTVLSAAPASAALTSSSITAPATGARILATSDTPPLTVSGTAPGSSGDTIDAWCYRGGQSFYVGQDSTSSGTFSIAGTVPTTAPVGACLLRAINPFSGSPDLSPFAGTWVTFERQLDRLDGARRYDFDDFVQQDRGGTGIGSIAATPGAGGLIGPRLTDNAAQANSADAFKYAGAFLQGDLTVDGHPAYAPKQAEAIDAAATGLPAVQVTRTRDGGAGDATVAEQDPLVRCPTDVTPATSSNCAAFSATGVRWDRTTITGLAGTADEQRDTFVSTDGAPHALSVWLGYSALTSDTTIAPTFGVSWAGGGALAARSAGETVGGPPGVPGTLFMARNGAAADGDPQWPRAAVTWDPGPGVVTFPSAKEAAARFENIAIPAGGSATLRTQYRFGTSGTDLAAAASAQRDAARAPSLTLSAPADATTSFTPAAIVTGTATDNERLASVTVDGQAVTPAADGTFSVTVPLALGANTITAVATDGAGQTATATRTVTYRDTVAPSLTSLSLSRTRFRVGRAPTATSAARRPAPTGTSIRFTLGEAAPVTIVITRSDRGRRVKGRCVAPARRLRRAARCTRTTTVGTLRRNAPAGPDAIAFSGRIGTRALRPGSHRATVTASDASGNTSRALTASFTIVTR